MSNETHAMARVWAGIEFLDSKVPNWRDKVSADIIAVYGTTRCPLGQIYGDYGSGCDTLNIGSWESTRYGFMSGDVDGVYVEDDELDQAWKAALAADSRIGKLYTDPWGYVSKVVNKTVVDGTVVWVIQKGRAGDSFVPTAGKNFIAETESQMESKWTEFQPVVNEVGDVLYDQDGNLYLVGAGGRVWQLEAGNMVTWASLESWEKSGKRLKQVTTVAGNRMSAKLKD